VVPADRVPLLSAYAERLATDGVVRGLIGPREVPRLWDRHLVNCALMADALPVGATVADVGSGAGLPGLVLAIVRPDVRMTLIEPLLRRTTFLSEVVDALGLENVVVRRDRADAVHGAQVFDAVTARAVAALDRLAGWCMPLVSPHGSMVAMKGSAAAEN
jgi:16S rRNA (guanine527-N7)-methyltransferase